VIAEIQITDQLSFTGGSDALGDASKETLRAVAGVLQSRKDVKRLTIEGHTCSDGPLEWNERLSRERAATVRGLLSGECGVAADRLSTVGFGPRKAITDEYCHRRRNRRVEFLVL
jgi:outer membrane protein OmpA-like peptidoglycan-associated protein